MVRGDRLGCLLAKTKYRQLALGAPQFELGIAWGGHLMNRRYRGRASCMMLHYQTIPNLAAHLPPAVSACWAPVSLAWIKSSRAWDGPDGPDFGRVGLEFLDQLADGQLTDFLAICHELALCLCMNPSALAPSVLWGTPAPDS